ncbi:DedD protein [Lebetimonas natsushimae]|uniref:DedD protein n=1 Tax=Lebetimonas natsushimae TaxID=1936991 RepID=A0A292YHC3_9BACT|nr:SPOR domain-containing protein [Lebetimonas natsushimae]GAX88180.1 DedD protein [Lebetimonas natsushimae]
MEKDDLLNIKPKKNIKKPLVYGAIAFLIFIIAVIAYAIYSNSKEENVVLPPQVNEQPKEKSSEFKEIPIEENTNTLSQKLITDNSEEINASGEKKNNSNINNQSVEKETLNQKSPVSAIEKKPENQAKNTASHKTEVKKIKNIKKALNVKYYIQVAALMKYKTPNKKFLNLIKKEGFNYTFYHTYIKKNNKKIAITKILIGPFENEKTARAKLRIVKEKITQNAFIFKVK